MKKISQLVVLFCAVAPMAAFSVTPDAPASTNSAAKAPSLDALFGDSIVAKGKGVEVKRNDLDSAVVKTKAMYASRNIPAPSDLEPQALKNLVIQQLILAQATDADRTKGKTNFEARLAKVKEDNHLTDEDFDKRISMQLFGGETREQWNKQNIDITTIPVVLERELKINITDADIKAFYDSPTNIASFEQPEMVRASHILLMTSDPTTQQPLSAEKKAEKRKQAEDILKQAKSGADFAELAKKYSEDPGSKDKGGEYTFPRGQMMKEFEDAAFSLKTNEISDIVETKYGFHIIKLSEKIPAKKVDYDKVKDGIKDHLFQLQLQKQLPAYTAKLVKDANVEILDEKLKNTNLAIEAPKEENTSAPVAVPTK
jgi:parvulin-like peptidyl-prolyl isomerase